MYRGVTCVQGLNYKIYSQEGRSYPCQDGSWRWHGEPIHIQPAVNLLEGRGVEGRRGGEGRGGGVPLYRWCHKSVAPIAHLSLLPISSSVSPSKGIFSCKIKIEYGFVSFCVCPQATCLVQVASCISHRV